MFDFENSQNKEELLEYAKSVNVPVHHAMGIDKIKMILRESPVELNSEAEIRASRKVKVLIHKTEGDTGSIDVPVSVNGKTWLIKRGVEVVIPAYVLEVLQNAIKDIYVQDDVTKSIVKREVPSYPFSYSEMQ